MSDKNEEKKKKRLSDIVHAAFEGKLDKSLEKVNKLDESERADPHTEELKKAIEIRISMQDEIKALTDKSKYPSTQGRVLKLKDGRDLGYEVYGFKESEGAKLVVFLYHGLPGCRLFCTETMSNVAHEMGIQIVVPERPGIGLSTTHQNLTFASFNEDVLQLADFLSAQRFSIIGYSAGGPFAVLSPKVIPAERLISVTLVSSLSPPETPNAYEGMNFMNKVSFYVARNMNWVLKTAVKSESSDLKHNPTKKIREMVPSSEEDQEVFLLYPEIEKVFIASAMEEYSRPHSVKAEANEYWMACHRSWNYNISEISQSIDCYIWYGLSDQGTVPSMGRYLAKAISHAKERAVEKKGHLLFFEMWPNFLKEILESYERKKN